jgi:transposase
MAVADRHGLPLAVDVASASPAEVKLVISTLEGRFLPDLPERLIGDKAYDSDPLAAQFAEGRIEPIPHRSNRKVKTQDGRPLRRYRGRGRIERLFAWLYRFRRLVNRWEYDVVNFLGFPQLVCIVILLRRCL